MKKIASAEIIIEKRINEVYSFVTNLDNYPYFTKVKRVEKVSGDGGVGTKYNLISSGFIAKVKTPIEITQKLAHQQFSFADKSVSYLSETGFLFEELPTSTKVTAYKSADIGIVLSILTLDAFVGRDIKKELNESLIKLKNIFEL